MFIVDNINDFSRYFSRTYIARQEGDKLVPYYVSDVNNTHIFLVPAPYTSSRKDVKTYTFTEVMDQFKLTAPRLGAISTPKGLWYTSISPARQYLKGITANRLIIKDFTKSLYNKTLDRVIESLYNRQFFTPSEIVKEISEGHRVGGAISSKCGIYVTEKNKNLLFTYGAVTLGVYQNNTFLFFSEAKAPQIYLSRTYPEIEIKLWQKTKMR